MSYVWVFSAGSRGADQRSCARSHGRMLSPGAKTSKPADSRIRRKLPPRFSQFDYFCDRNAVPGNQRRQTAVKWHPFLLARSFSLPRSASRGAKTRTRSCTRPAEPLPLRVPGSTRRLLQLGKEGSFGEFRSPARNLGRPTVQTPKNSIERASSPAIIPRQWDRRWLPAQLLRCRGERESRPAAGLPGRQPRPAGI